MPTMHGPAFDSEGKTVNREVPAEDVVAFEQAGYVKGAKEGAPTLKAGESKGGSAEKEEAEKEKAEKAAEAEKAKAEKAEAAAAKKEAK